MPTSTDLTKPPTALRGRRVAVVGCGTAGPAVALLLARAGVHVEVFERVESPSPVGAGIVLQPTGLCALARLGLAERVIARGARIDRLWARTDRGRSVIDLAYRSVDGNWYGIGMHRGALFEALYEALRAEPVAVHLGVDVRDLADNDGTTSTLVASDGTRHGPFDLVVVADGSRSQLRDDTDRSIRKVVRPYAWGALWHIGPDPEGAHAGTLWQWVRGPQRLLGLLPTGFGPGDAQQPLLTVYWSVRNDRVAALRAAGLDAWKREVLSIHPGAEAALASVGHMDDLVHTTYQHVRMKRWHTTNLVYIGDAAHAMSPQLGQGCNLALVDACVLAESLLEAPSIEDALATYSRRRRAHLSFYQVATWLLTPFFQSDSRVLGWLRDWGLGTFARMGWFRRQMITSMGGVKTGLLTGTMPLSAIGALPPGAPADRIEQGVKE